MVAQSFCPGEVMPRVQIGAPGAGTPCGRRDIRRWGGSGSSWLLHVEQSFSS